ncbi:hypothetical protein QYE76_065586 [Lolium multiflorum]|uniref:Uncharacterized protein n=1 Tax=Lolium multiflorum TaxID=4521 RepID=A0AAD8S8S9_LOLMU|nr:hypothetical protein QYE76_065586 [Lolium multiflorum]
MQPAVSVLRFSILRRSFFISSVVSKVLHLSLQFTQAPVAASNVATGVSAAAPVQAPFTASNVAAGASATGASATATVQAPVAWDPYEPVSYVAPENPYNTSIVDDEPEVQSSDVDSDDESFHTKTRHVLRRLQSGHYDGPFARGIYKCPFCNRKLRPPTSTPW